eukprot:2960262-Amphidinium_carterae.1
MSTRKPASVKAWETVLQQGAPQKQIDAAERLLRQSWVLPLPVQAANPWIEPNGHWCEALVLAVFWAGGPGTPMSRAVIAVPASALDDEEEGQLVLACLYLPGEETINGEHVGALEENKQCSRITIPGKMGLTTFDVSLHANEHGC